MIEKEELLSIIPHRDRMLLLDRVSSYDLEGRSIEAEYQITENCIFYDYAEQGVPSWVGFEFMAQAICAFCGIRDKMMGVPQKKGFILAVSQLQAGLPFFKAGSIISIKTREVERLYPVCVLEGELLLGGKKVLEGKLTIMEVDGENEKRLSE